MHWHEGALLYLTSQQGGLARLRPDGESEELWAAGGAYFSKGLAVVGHLAYFGLARKQGDPWLLGTALSVPTFSGSGCKHRTFSKIKVGR